MSIYKTAINKPITTLLIFVAVIILGLFSLRQLPIDRFPKIEPPYVSVLTTYSGANSSEIEANVTKLLENSLNSVDGLKELTSNSKDNMSLITLEFEWDSNIDEAVNDIRSAIDMVTNSLPDGCSKPLIFKFNSSMAPIMGYYFTATESYPGLEKILEDNVVNVLNKVDGIGNLSLAGAPKRYVYVDLDPNKVDAYNLTLEQIGQAVANNNLNLASGSVKMGKEQYQLRVQSEYVESSELNDIIVTTSPLTGAPVYLRDIANVRDTIKDISLEEKINGKDGVRLIIMKQTDANTVEIGKAVKKEMEKIKHNLPPDVEMGIIFESGDEITNAVNGLVEAVMYALIFVVIVILFFLGKWRATLIISLTIPISLIVAFIYLFFTGSSLNIISLSSLSIAIGMVVDDAIVVLENITRHIERGSSPREAAIYATNEVWVSVIATTLVIVAVFVPLTMLGGMAGIMFKELGWIVTIVVCTSTCVAISLTPMLSSKLLKANKVTIDETGHVKEVKNENSFYQRTVVRILDKIDVFYANFLRKCLAHKKITILIAFLIFVASMIPFIAGKIGTEFMPTSDNGRVNVSIELQRGTRVEEAIKTARYIEERIKAAVPELKLISSSTGADDEAGIASLFGNTGNNRISMIVKVSKKNERDRSIEAISEDIRKELDAVPSIVNYQVATTGGMSGGNSAVDIEIFGYDFDKTNAVAADVKEMLKGLKNARDIHVSREEDRAELKVVFDKTKLALHGLNSATAATYVRNRINGMLAGYLKEDGDEYDIVVRVAEEYRNTITKIEELSIMSPRGEKIKLKEIASVQEYWNPPTIERKSRQRMVKVSVTPVNTSLGELAKIVENELNKMPIPQDVRVNIGGDYEDQNDTFADMALLMILIIILVYVVMASQFESYAKPFIIMFAVPFAISGAVLALFITNTTLNIVGALGVILLVGIVAKNGIVLVDYINLMRDRGMELKEAIAVSGQSRLRPVLMTAATTILGMVPMALSTSEGSEMWVSMGTVVIGGLTFSTIVTLIIVPIFYSIVAGKAESDKTEKTRQSFIFMNLSDK